ncbi:MAG: tRNA guanosine(34) transglycosylase Tgt [Bacteroidales bacterium]|jgi:queuine tRNA-ribosyltransferase|nr:tRNA guanosine(34) transglycosylase Tgt [Bacteroidales bacterium]
MQFKIHKKDTKTKARTGIIHTDHGDIQTPIFMPVGTVGSVKAVNQRDLIEDVKAQIILGNTYHLYLRPGTNTLEKAGGLHKFINWDRPLLTDSGGYQVFSLSSNRKLTQEGAHFRSHIDGSKHLFTPENTVDKQRIIGADIIMALDECTPYPCDYKYAKDSMKLTHQWLARGIKQFDNTNPIYDYKQTFFPIVQGSVFKDLRIESAKTIASFERDGYAIGGLSVGEPAEQMYEMIDIVNEILPKEKPRYLMGVGTPINILEGIARGIDMFDCVMPTRNGRNGMLFTKNGIINIKNKKWEQDFSPIEADGASFVDQKFSKAYLRHLFKAKEYLSGQIASLHNLSFYLWLVNEARDKINHGTFYVWKNEMTNILSQKL